MRVVLIDANSLIHRVYHALPRLTDFQGRPTNALYGLSNILLRFLKDYKPDYIFALYDRPEPTLRHQAFKEYKAQRPKAPDDLKIQIGLSKKIFLGFNIPIIEKTGYEADDLIASLKERFKSFAKEIVILTGDLDTLQLVDEKTKILTMKKGISEMKIYDIEEVKNKFGILPEKVPDFKALVGDKSDNIPGIPGIGEKTASLLINKFGDLEKIIEEAEKGKLDPSFRSKILENKERLLFFKDLVTLRKDISFDFEPEKMKYEGYNEENLIKVFEEFSFKSLIERFKKEKPGLFSLKKGEEVKKEEGKIESLNSPFFLYLNKDILEVYDGSNVKTFPLFELKNLLSLPHEKIVYDFKELIKITLKDDFYFDKKISLEKIFDLKIVFWLLNPERSNFTFEDNLRYYLKENFENIYSSSLKVYEILKKELEEKELRNLYYDLEIKISPLLARMEFRGIKVDLEKLEEFKKFLKKEIEKIVEEIYVLAGRRFNLNSPHELSFILFEVLKLPTKNITKTKSGIYSTQEADLLKIIDSHPIIEKILSYREYTKLLRTYTEGFLKYIDFKNKKIYTLFNQTKAATGRIVSEKPNLQNLPLKGDLAKEFRKIFVSEEGFVFISADYSQIELRILAHLSQDENLILAFKEGWDIHSEVAKYVFGKEDQETRRKAKIINFGIVYGISPRGLAERLGVSLNEAKNLMERFFNFYPKVKEYQKRSINFAKEKGYAETLLGRKRFLPEIYSLSYKEKSEAERIAINMPIQGLGADILKKALLEIEKKILENGWQNNAFFVLTIHDEIILEVKEEVKEEIKVIIKEVMENVMPLSVPLKVNISEGKNLADFIK